MSFGSRLKARREQLGLTQVALAKKLGITKGAVGNYEIEASSPKAEILYKVFDVLKCDANYLFQDEMSQLAYENKPTHQELSIIKKYRVLDSHGKEMVEMVVDKEHERCIEPPEEDEEEQNIITLPAYWNKASAGEGYDLDTDDCDELQVILNESTRKADMIISIQGDSMEPRYHDGDRVLVRKQPEIELGQVGIFRVGTMGYIKERGPDRLISINPNYEDVYIGEEEECVCIGKVMGVLEDEWIVG